MYTFFKKKEKEREKERKRKGEREKVRTYLEDPRHLKAKPDELLIWYWKKFEAICMSNSSNSNNLINSQRAFGQAHCQITLPLKKFNN